MSENFYGIPHTIGEIPNGSVIWKRQFTIFMVWMAPKRSAAAEYTSLPPTRVKEVRAHLQWVQGGKGLSIGDDQFHIASVRSILSIIMTRLAEVGKLALCTRRVFFFSCQSPGFAGSISTSPKRFFQ